MDGQVIYVSHNYPLLRLFQDYLNIAETSFFHAVYRYDRTEIQTIYRNYLYYSDIDYDIVASAICSVIRTLEDYYNGITVKHINRLHSFIQAVMETSLIDSIDYTALLFNKPKHLFNL
ncbi:hypothetical protein [Kurthia huakuii]|uniref:hypothetical protein n=1 Tax=Kurthia huakuii TaxID=1421019 RepID=UPI0004961F7D|nr:hypothetical protein [Kurthia huakuii]MBM7700133.1 hypothetical protein [Kurthia huakuii]